MEIKISKGENKMFEKFNYNWEQAWNKFRDLPRSQRSIIMNSYFIAGGLFVILILAIAGL